MERRERTRTRLALTLLALAPALLACAEERDGLTGPIPGLAPTVLGVEPAVVEAGSTATVRGLNFPDDPGVLDVRFGEITPSVTSASETSLRLRLPPASEAPCRPTRRVPLRVSVAGSGDSLAHRFSVAPALSLAPRASRRFVNARAPLGCRELPAVEGEFLISVFNASRSPGNRVSFELRGRTGAGQSDTATASAAVRGTAGGAGGVASHPAAVRRVSQARQGHRRILEANRRLLARARSRGAEPGGRVSAAETRADQPPPSVGELVQFRVPDLNSQGGVCENYVEVTARVAHVTEHAVLVSDTSNPIDEEYDDRLRDMGDEFESRMWPVLRDHFGDPLRMDEQLNDDGHLYMLFTPEVNDFGNVLAFVFSGDFFPRTSSDSTQLTCASSDTAEVFYSRAPTRVDANEFGSLETTAGWQRVLRPTLIHEVKHLTANAERISRDLAPETVWLEEATAHMAEEIYAREIFGTSRGSNATYRETLFCAVRPTTPECEGTPFVMVSEFAWLAEYLGNVTDLSPVDGSGPGAFFRGSGWWLLRWAVDHGPVSESQFLQSVVASPVTGTANLEARTGRSWSEMIADWTLSLAVDDRLEEGPERPELTVPSWDVRDVFGGLHRDFGQGGGVFGDPYPLATRPETYGSFTRSVSGLPGGSAAIFRLSGRTGATQLLELTGPGGGEVPTEIGVSVLRSF